MATDEKGYVDATYLDAVQRLMAGLKRTTYERMHLQPGHTVLDAGCGPDRHRPARVVGRPLRPGGRD